MSELKIKRERPTLKTIAQITGLAITTVSRALSGAPEIALSTRQLVAKTADEIGYIPDRAAQRLRTGRTNVISLILSPHDEILGFSNSLTLGLSRALKGTRFNLLVTPSFQDGTEFETIKKIVANKLADGVIFSRTEPDDERVKMLIENNFPFVCHGRTEIKQHRLFVDYDNHQFAKMAVEKLAQKGCKKIFSILPNQKFNFHTHIKSGLVEASNAQNIELVIPDGVNLDSPTDPLYHIVDKVLNSPHPPDGFVCSGEILAMIILACATDNHLKTGQDIHIITKQTSRLFDHIRPKLDTIFEDISEAGMIMGEMLLREITAPGAKKNGFLQSPGNKK